MQLLAFKDMGIDVNEIMEYAKITVSLRFPFWLDILMMLDSAVQC